MLESTLRRASIALLLAVVACGAPPPPAAPAVPVVQVAAPAGTGVAAEGSGVAPGDSGAAGNGGLNGGSADLGPIPVTTADPAWGSGTAPVTIVEFGDFQCPFCSRFAASLDQLRRDYGPTKLRIVWKNNPLQFHANARPAAEIGVALYEKGGASWFWQYHDALYRKPLSTPEAVAAGYQFTGLTEAQVNTLVARGTAARKVDDDIELAKQVGVTGTPASFINGVFVSGAQPVERLHAIIDEQLTAAGALASQGVPPNRIYARLATENVRKAPKPTPPDADADADDKSIWRVPVGTSPVRGNVDAPVTMIMFADYQCPFCVRAAATVEKLSAVYGDKLRIVFKHNPLPFHPRAEPAAELALEARAEKGDAAFWKADALLWAQSGKLEDPDLDAVATAAGLNAALVKKAIQTHKYKAKIEEDQDLADDMAASGTPQFFINGQRVVGAQPIEKFRAVIDAQLAIANAELAKGTPAAKLYETLIKDGKSAPPPEKKSVGLPTKDNPSKGPANAKVTIQIFADFQCPFCRRVNATLAELDAAFPGKLRFVWRNLPLPFHPNAMPAAEVAMEAFAQKGSVGFWKIHDLIFGNATDVAALEPAALDGYAAQVGLDANKLAASRAGHTHQAVIEADAAAARDAGITGTPAFVINGYFLSGAQPLAKFKKLVERALKEAK